MAVQKKHGKGRLDKWYKLAKEKGYRARAAFKLIQLNKKYHILEKSKVLIDLCAAPGSWCQVAAEVMPPNSLIVGVDLAPIKPIPRCITFQSDITTDKCRATIRQHLKSWKADTVLHDGAPNVGTAWVQDAFSQAELVLQSLRLATEFLAPGGTFITKIFRSKDYNSLLWVFNQLFGKVEATKPPSSRNVSAEIFVVCRDFKAPKRIDPKFLDPRSVFEELADPTPNNEAKVYNPEKKKRKRDGYEEGNYTQFKEIPAFEFIESTDPIAILGSLNRLSFEGGQNGDIALAALKKMPETTREIRNCCEDLRVLGRKEFKLLLRWRLKMREKFDLSTKSKSDEASNEVVDIKPMDEEMQIQEDLQREKDKQDSRKKKARRRENERKQKEIVRMQLNMTTPMEIGLEQNGPIEDDAIFALKTVDKGGGYAQFSNGKMHTVIQKVDMGDETEDESDTDEEEDRLERQLDDLYEEYQERKSRMDAKYKAKKARKEGGDGDFEGFSDRDVSSDEDEEVVEDEHSDASSDQSEEEDNVPVLHKISIGDRSRGALSRRAATFFEQDIFKDMAGLEDATHDDSGIDMEDESDQILPTTKSQIIFNPTSAMIAEAEDAKEMDTGFEIVKSTPKGNTIAWNEDPVPEPMKNGRPDVDIITAEAMTLAHEIASGKKTKHDLRDDNFNKYALRDVEGLPDWFLDDENAHSKPHRPITAAGAAAIKEKLRALNARPIKKVREAKMRKKFKAAQRLEKLKKKSALLIEDGDMSEKDKAATIAKLMAKASKKKPKKEVKIVVATGGNRAISGRPRGTKGRYKMVDARMKKDTRALKRLAKKKK